MRPPLLLRVVALLLIGLLPVQGMAMAFSRTIGEAVPQKAIPAQAQGHESAAHCHHLGGEAPVPQPGEAPNDSAQHCAQGHACCAAHLPPTRQVPIALTQTADPPRVEATPAVPAYCPERLPRPPRA